MSLVHYVEQVDGKGPTRFEISPYDLALEVAMWQYHRYEEEKLVLEGSLHASVSSRVNAPKVPTGVLQPESNGIVSFWGSADDREPALEALQDLANFLAENFGVKPTDVFGFI